LCQLASIPDPESARAIADVIASAERPIILAGRGVLHAGAKEAVLELAERSGALLSTTLPTRGLFEGNPYAIGIAGGWSSDFTTELFAESDLVIAIGASLTGFTTHFGRLYPKARVVQIDANPRAVRHNRVVANYHLRCDARLGVTAINKYLAQTTGAKTGYAPTSCCAGWPCCSSASPKPPPKRPGTPSAPSSSACTPSPSPGRPAPSARPPNRPRPSATCSRP